MSVSGGQGDWPHRPSRAREGAVLANREGYTAVGTVKALHLLAPHYFPLWDEAIAIAYGYRYNRENGAQKYLPFCKDMLKFKKHVTEKGFVAPDKNALKKIDEYNYVTYTKPEWLDRR